MLFQIEKGGGVKKFRSGSVATSVVPRNVMHLSPLYLDGLKELGSHDAY